MPGFVVGPSLGGHRSTPVSSKVEYYYNYFWEIGGICGSPVVVGSPLIHLKEATLPTFTVNKEIYHGASLEYKFAKSVTWDDIRVSWYDSRGLIEYIKAWRQKVWTNESGLQAASVYKLPSWLMVYLPTGEANVTWFLHNSWPSQIRHSDLTYTNSDVKLVEVTVTYDWADENYGSTKSSP